MQATHKPISSIAYVLSAVLIVVAVLAFALSFLLPGLYRDPAVMAGSARGTALIMLIVAVPLLAVSMAITARGYIHGRVTWLGALIFLAYNSAVFCFGVAFNMLFLFYVATFALSLWSMVAFLGQISVKELMEHFHAGKIAMRFIAGYSILIALFFYVFWLSQVVPAIFSAGPPAFLQGTGLLVNVFHVLDLGFTLPSIIVGSVWFLKKRAWGYIIVGGMLTSLCIETASIATDQWFGAMADPASSVASVTAVPIFAVLTVIGLIPLALYLRSLKH